MALDTCTIILLRRWGNRAAQRLIDRVGASHTAVSSIERIAAAFLSTIAGVPGMTGALFLSKYIPGFAIVQLVAGEIAPIKIHTRHGIRDITTVWSINPG